MSPLVSVVLPAYNAEVFLADAVESILDQTFRDFELLVIDDGSTDTTHAIANRYTHDTRVRVLTHEQNRGLIAALNTGCQAAQGTYIAIMHADDISLPQRLAQQVAYMEAHAEIGVLGTCADNIDERGQSLGITHMLKRPGVIGWTVMLSCPHIHPTVMFRRKTIAPLGFYHPGNLLVEDYDLWMRAARVTQLSNLPEVLVHYRVWVGSASGSQQRKLDDNALRVVQRGVSAFLGHDISLELASWLRGIADSRRGARPQTLDEIQETAHVLEEMLTAYLTTTDLSASDRRWVQGDAAIKLLVLARLARRHSVAVSVQLFTRALYLSPTVLFQAAAILWRKRSAESGT